MKKNYTVLFLLLLICTYSISPAQTECGGGRYISPLFSNFVKHADITYGSNINVLSQNQSLEMDIYEPDGDTLAARPLIVMAHGGSFLFGTKDQVDIIHFAQDFAKMGYVTASIEYRLGMENLPFPGPDSSDAAEAVLRGVHDAKAAVRFFYKDAATANAYRIDTNRIYFMGSSAGGFIGLHYAYLDKESEIPIFMDTSKTGLGGGIAGESGNPGYSDNIHGVVNLSGALGDTAWIEAGDEPVVSLHGTNDNVVPYDTDLLILIGFYEIITLDGSKAVHAKADQVGLTNCFHTFWGEGHVPYVDGTTLDPVFYDTTFNISSNFLHGLACNTTPVCGYTVGLEEDLANGYFHVYPNPAHHYLKIEIPELNNEMTEILLIDFSGRVVGEWKFNLSGIKELELEGINPGLYFTRITKGSESISQKIIIH